MLEPRESDGGGVEVRLLSEQPVMSIRSTVKVGDLKTDVEEGFPVARTLPGGG